MNKVTMAGPAIRLHRANDATGLRECNQSSAVNVVLRNDGSVDVYGEVAIIDQRDHTTYAAAVSAQLDHQACFCDSCTPRYDKDGNQYPQVIR